MYFDTHAHYDDARFDMDRGALLDMLPREGVDLVVVPGSDMASSARAVALAGQYPYVYAAVGVHPQETGAMCEADVDALRRMADDAKVVAIGEIGLDYYYDEPSREIQKTWFARQIALAKELGLPIVVHNRDAHADCLAMLRQEDVGRTGCVMHCFSGSVEYARQCLALGMYLSVGGVLTFKNAARLPQVIEEVPLERLFLETDSPYLAPEPHRGKRNDSRYLKFVAQKIAEIKQIPIEQVAAVTKQNACRFFGISD